MSDFHMMHGRAAMSCVEDIDDRRWVKRLWLSSAFPETQANTQYCNLFYVHHNADTETTEDGPGDGSSPV